jgi:hypothetical protein
MSYNEPRIYLRKFTQDELLLLRETVRGEIKFCENQVQIINDEEDDRNMNDKTYIQNSVVKTYNKLRKEYESILVKLDEGYEDRFQV